MRKHFALLAVISLCFAGCIATSDCEKNEIQSELAKPYLDIAVDMITKVKHDFPECCKARTDCEKKLAGSYLDVAINMTKKAKQNFPACCKDRSHCEKELADAALDVAVDMISKAKSNFPECSKVRSYCEKNLAEFHLDVAVNMIAKVNSNFSECVSCDNDKLPERMDEAFTLGAKDCSEILERGYTKSGVYKIWPSTMTENRSLEVYCDMQTDCGGWTLIQRRGNFNRPEDYFYRDWKSYKEGFGDIDKDFWLGNDNIFALTNQKAYSMRVDLRDMTKNKTYAHYDTFRIDDESNKYTLHIDDYSGDAGDSMIHYYSDNKKFSTKDQDNDQDDYFHCAERCRGGWWYGGCCSENPNGLYLKEADYEKGIIWYSWKRYEPLESTEIKIRPKMFKLTDANIRK